MAESPYQISAVLSVGEANNSFATWNSSTALNTVALVVNNDYSYNTCLIVLNQTSTITGGVVTFEGSIDGITFFPLDGFTPGTFAAIGPTYTLQASTFATFSFNLTGIPYFQVRLSTVISGTGAVTVGFAADSFVNTIGATITNTVAVSGTVAATQSGTWNIGTLTSITNPVTVSQATAANLNATVTGTVAVTQSTSPWVTSDNNAVAQGSATSGEKGFLEMGAVTTANPAYVTGQSSPLSLDTAGNLRITNTGLNAVTQSTSPWVDNITQWASTALGAPQAFGTAPAGIVIGTSSDIYVAGTRARSNQTTTAAGVMDVNIVGSLGATNSATNGTFIAITDNTTKVSVIAATAALKTDMSSVAGTATSTAAAGVQKVGIVGNSGAVLDSTATPATAPANALLTSGIYNTSSPDPTSGQATSIQLDQDCNHLMFPGVQQSVGAAWSSATTLNTLQYPTGTATQGQLVGIPAIIVQLDQTTTLTGGAVTFQGTYDNVNWVTIPAAQIIQPNTFAQLTNPYTFVASTQQPFLILLQGYISIRLNLTTVITGTGTVTPYWATLPDNPITTTVVTGTSSTGSIQVSVVPSANTFFSHGFIASTSTAQQKVESTTYTEQTTAVQRSMSSSSANDTSAGTGARTVTITYFDASGNGPFTTVVTLNGTTAVSTTATNICFVEKMQVTTVGSTGSNVGTITLFAATAGGGGAVGTIAATTNQTFWAHHYVENGKTFHLTGINVGSTSTTVGDGGQFALYAMPIPEANQPNQQISDFLLLYGQSSTVTRTYNSPIAVAGPARITAYVTPFSGSGNSYYAAFDFFEQ